MLTTPFNDNTPTPFGRHKGTAVANVPATYLLWLFNEGCTHEGVKQYINDNLAALNKEAENVRKY